MKNECKIVRDILPLYLEGMVSEETASFVEEHLESCDECSTEMEKMKKNIKSGISSAEKDVGGSDETVPLKVVKKKLLKRRMAAVSIAVIITVTMVGIISSLFHSVNIDYGVSEKYSQEEMDAAIDLIEEQFHSWEGCKLYSINYTSDEFCKSEVDYVNTLADEGVIYTDCIVFRTHFRSPIFGGGAWNANFKYNWSWYLARTQGGEWELLTWGMP